MLLAAGVAVVLGSCSGGQKKTAENAGANPFFTEYSTPFDTPPFDKIELQHYKPAFLRGIEEQNKEVDAIVNNPEAPTFANTLVAFDQCGDLLRRVSIAFENESSINSNDSLQALQTELSPILSKHSDDIIMNEKLFARIKAVFDKKDSLNLNKEDMRLVKETYKDFVRGGANLDSTGKAELRKVNEKIDLLQLTFSQNVLKETNAFKLVVDKKSDLSGLPETEIQAAADAAKDAGMKGKWVFTLHNPSVMPFLQYADNRDLRRQMLEAYLKRGDNNNANDNKKIVKELVAARLQKAKILGYKDFAAFVLDDCMAKDEKAVYNLLDQIWKPALKKAGDELADINAEIKKEGGNFKAEAWDWRYYFEKAKKSRFDLNENEIRPYLELNNVRDGVFYVANKLYGVTWKQRKDVPLPDKDAQAFEFFDKDGTTLGLLYMDFYTRPGKSNGAWCGSYVPQTYKNGKRVPPVVTTVFNFSKPAAGQPALLSSDEASTVFHECGHAFNALFSDVHYYGVSDVPRDFVELPSQLNEHWCFEPEVLKVYAKNYKTGEVIPDALVKKIIESGKYGQGFGTTEYTAASYLDMDYHVLKDVPQDLDVDKFESKSLAGRGLISQIPPRYRTTYFLHTMEGGYTAGYYSYIWAEVLDCDAYEAFKETGDIFNQKVAEKYRKCILAPGCIDDAMDMYVNFRGKKPTIHPLLRNRGLE